MSSSFIALSIYIFITFLFYAWYFSTRYNLKKGKIFRVAFALNMVAGVLIVFPLPYYFLNYFEVYDPLLNICLFLMALAIVLHHGVLLLNENRKNKKVLEEIHIPISHLLLGIPYILAGILGLLDFFPKVSSLPDLISCLVWFSETVIIGVGVILIGLKLFKLNLK